MTHTFTAPLHAGDYVVVPFDVEAALSEAGWHSAFDAWSYTRWREAVDAIEAAKRPEPAPGGWRGW